MNADEFFPIGKVVKASGSAGELLISLDTDLRLDYKKMESVFIRFNGNLVPFFIEHFNLRSPGNASVKLLDVNTNDELSKLLGGILMLPSSMKPKSRKARSLDIDLTGFELQDVIAGSIGFVTGLLELPMQELLRVDYKGREVLIPLVEDFIESFDPRKKIILLRLPEGLLEI
jgi:16S rRNA processing protein RimM